MKKITNAQKVKLHILKEYSEQADSLKNLKILKLLFYLVYYLENEIFKLRRNNLKKQIIIDNKKMILNKIYRSRTWNILNIYKKFEKAIISNLKLLIPLKYRKLWKSHLVSKFFIKNSFPVPLNIIKEWNNWTDTRSNDSFDIMIFSVIAWDYRIQRPQHLSKYIANSNNRIFYIKNEFIPGVIVDGYAPFKVDKKDKNIYEITLSASRNLFIYEETPSQKDLKIIFASINNLINNAKIINPVAKIDHPFWEFTLRRQSMFTLYDCMDNHAGFNETSNNVKHQEKILFKKSDLTIVTSEYLKNLAESKFVNKLIKIPNAGDYLHFSVDKLKNLSIPNELKNIKHPIIGYYGAIAEWFDTELLELIAKEHVEKSIVLIGRVTNNKVLELSKKYHNIYLFGEIPYDNLPKYLKQFDVCLIPFVLNELIKATHPVKIFEYLAAGKPVVATNMPEILDLKNLIYFGDKDSFPKQIEVALVEKKDKLIERINYAKENTWQIRSKKLINEINNILYPKVSIIILSFNNHIMLKKTMDSVLNRSFYDNFEVIVVDNASDDKTKKTLIGYSTNHKVRIIYNTKNEGFAKGNNIGLKVATGQFLILLNNDVIVTPGWISRLVYHVQKENVGLVGPITNNIGNEAKVDTDYDTNNSKEIENFATRYTSQHWGVTFSIQNLAAFCWIMSKETYKEVGELDERFGKGMFEDDDYCTRLKLKGKLILCAEDVFVHHYGGASFGKLPGKEYIELFEKNKKIYEKKWNTKWLPHKYRK